MGYYVIRTGKLKEFFEKIKKVARPGKADNKWLDSLDFQSKNYYQYLQVLERLGFVDSTRRPTARWEKYQVPSTSKEAMAEGLREGFDILWQTYPDTPNQSVESLAKVFQVKLNVNEATSRRANRTFSILSDFADFSSLEKTSPGPTFTPTRVPTPAHAKTIAEQPLVTISPDVMSALIQQKRELGVNINIQVTLPETTDAGVYEKIFAALKRNFFSE